MMGTSTLSERLRVMAGIMMENIIKTATLMIISASLTACGKADDASGRSQKSEPVTATPAVKRSFDFAQMTRGGQLFQQYCAGCHGTEAEGAPNWQQRDADGKFPAPPLNGSGHAWHHSTAALTDVIKNGTTRIGGKMPPWKEVLSEQDITDIIAWFQAKWPDEVYAAWYKNHQGN